LEFLQLFDNNLHGVIPPLLGANNSQLGTLDLSGNQLKGSIPPYLCKHQNLIILGLDWNFLVGNIPLGVKACTTLTHLWLANNMLTGSL
jgi:Leucine-rich repeat (LRR) protein